MEEDLRLIANPHLLANEKTKYKESNNNNIQFTEKLNKLLSQEYNIYLSDQIILKIKSNIDNEISNMNNERIIYECLEYCIQRVIQENKFDFCLPMD